MTDPGPPLARDTLLAALEVHPRVAFQGRVTDERARARLADTLPTLVPFKDRYVGALSVVDWDHKLPSAQLVLRIYAFHSDKLMSAGRAAFAARAKEIAQADRFPEFDVPDYAGLPADEAYECDLAEDGSIARCRLVSEWRRDIPDAEATSAVDAVRSSPEFAHVAASASGRPRHLGDLEAVSWTPPCESGHSRWTLDVWYLLQFDGRVGTGRSLLVEMSDSPAERRVVAVRDFAVKAM